MQLSNPGPKRIHNPIPPEFANVSLLRIITVTVAIVSLIMVSYATWVIYTMSNRVSTYESTIELKSVPPTVAPINFKLLDDIITLDHDKQSFVHIPMIHDSFYDRMITSTPFQFINLRAISSSTPLITSFSTSTTSTEL